jgi:hypothetical protein
MFSPTDMNQIDDSNTGREQKIVLFSIFFFSLKSNTGI